MSYRHTLIHRVCAIGFLTCPPDVERKFIPPHVERKFIPPHVERKFIPTCEVIDILIVGVHGDIDDHLPVSCK